MKAWLDIRETYMHESAQRERRAAQNILIICGACHVLGLAREFLVHERVLLERIQ
jgi:hypothetical protein